MIRIFLFLFFWFSVQAFGQCIKGNCHNGYGTYIFDNSDQYVGNWTKGKQNGKGTYIWTNGDIQVVVPRHKEIAEGTAASILKKARRNPPRQQEN